MITKTKYIEIDPETGIGYLIDDHSMTMYAFYTKCNICGRFPTIIYYDSGLIKTYYHCPTCNMEDYKPKGWFKKLLWFFDKNQILKK